MNRSVLPLMLATLAGCATRTPAGPVDTLDVPTPPSLDDGNVTYMEYQATSTAVADSLARLDALQLLEVGAMVVDAPTGSQNCYGPCEDDPADQAWMQEHARQAARLDAFVSLAEEVAGSPAEPAGDVTAAIAALDGLAIFESVVPHYVSDGSCYLSVCPGDDEKRGRIEALAEAAEGL